MFIVVFEVQPHRDRVDAYLGLARALRPELAQIDGFIDNERYASRSRDGLLLALSTWRDEKALIRWRTHQRHHDVQEKGRGGIFADYRLRVGEVTRDSAASAAALPQARFDATEVGDAKLLTISECETREGQGASAAPLLASVGLDRPHPGLIDQDVFESITNPGKLLALAAWEGDDAARVLDRSDPAVRQMEIWVIRDYGMFTRHEAPQYYPDVATR